jgi:hypothetical protein
MTRAAHRSVRRERPRPGPHRSRGSGSWAGWPSSSHRPASIDPFEAHSIVASLSRLARSPAQHFEGQRLSAPRVTDRPRLVGWSSLHHERHRSLTSLVAIAGTASPVPGPAGSWLAVRLATRAEAFTCVAKIAAALRLALHEHTAIETPSVVSRSTRVAPGPPSGARSLFESYARLAHRSRRGGAAACVSTSCGNLFGQCRGVHVPCGPSSASDTGGASDRLLPSHVFVRAPAPRWFPMRHAR